MKIIDIRNCYSVEG